MSGCVLYNRVSCFELGSFNEKFACYILLLRKAPFFFVKWWPCKAAQSCILFVVINVEKTDVQFLLTRPHPFFS